MAFITINDLKLGPSRVTLVPQLTIQNESQGLKFSIWFDFVSKNLQKYPEVRSYIILYH